MKTRRICRHDGGFGRPQSTRRPGCADERRGRRSSRISPRCSPRRCWTGWRPHSRANCRRSRKTSGFEAEGLVTRADEAVAREPERRPSPQPGDDRNGSPPTAGLAETAETAETDTVDTPEASAPSDSSDSPESASDLTSDLHLSPRVHLFAHRRAPPRPKTAPRRPAHR